MTWRERLQLEKWLERHPEIEDFLGFFVGIGVIVLLLFEIAKDKIKRWLGYS